MKQAVFLAAIVGALFDASTLCAQSYYVEAESGTLGGTRIQSSRPGFTGSGYVNFDVGNSVEVSTLADAGKYELWIRYNSPHSEKGYDFQLNGVTGSGMFDKTGANEYRLDRAGMFVLPGGSNSIRVDRGWGWYNVDAFELRPFTQPTLLPVSNLLVDQQADRRTQMLMNYLVSQYGHKTLSGLQHNSSENRPFPRSEFLNQSGGVVPAIRGSDLIDYSPSRIAFGENPQNETEQTIAWAKQTGGIASVMWHWNAPANLVNTPCGNVCTDNDYPWWRGFYSKGTTFDLAGALANPTGGDYQLLIRDIDAIAVQLKKYQDAGVPVIWRPLHEAQGNEPSGDAWFWWGADGPESFKQLWRVMHDRLTDHHGLHNLIWEFTSSAAQPEHLNWYPGDDVVDMVGLDIYTDPSATMNGQYYDILEFYNGRKLLAVSETDTLVNPDTMNLWGTKWSYVAPWAWDYVMREYANAGYSTAQLSAILQQFLNHESVITLNELPVLPWNNAAPTLPGDYNEDGTVDAADYTIWRDTFGQAGTALAADGDGDGVIGDGDYAVWQLFFGETAAGLGGASVPEPASLLSLIAGIALASCALRWRSVAAI